jgi:hypothetical protein
MGKLAPIALSVLAIAGCADEEDEFVRSPQQAGVEVRCVEAPHATTEDAFWLAEQASEATRPPPLRRPSVSLGYSGDGLLSGGITRDTPVYVGPTEQPEPVYVPDPPYQWHFAPSWRYRR